MLVTFDNHIAYDLSEFCKYHPGGIMVLENCHGTNIMKEFGMSLTKFMIS